MLTFLSRWRSILVRASVSPPGHTADGRPSVSKPENIHLHHHLHTGIYIMGWVSLSEWRLRFPSVAVGGAAVWISERKLNMWTDKKLSLKFTAVVCIGILRVEGLEGSLAFYGSCMCEGDIWGRRPQLQLPEVRAPIPHKKTGVRYWGGLPQPNQITSVYPLVLHSNSQMFLIKKCPSDSLD